MFETCYQNLRHKKGSLESPIHWDFGAPDFVDVSCFFHGKRMQTSPQFIQFDWSSAGNPIVGSLKQIICSIFVRFLQLPLSYQTSGLAFRANSLSIFWHQKGCLTVLLTMQLNENAKQKQKTRSTVSIQ